MKHIKPPETNSQILDEMVIELKRKHFPNAVIAKKMHCSLTKIKEILRNNGMTSHLFNQMKDADE